MSVVAFILLLIAAILFLLGRGRITQPWYDNNSLGLFFLTAGLICQFLMAGPTFSLH